MKRRFRFDVTPEEAQPCARRLAEELSRRNSVIVEQAAWPDAPYRTTLFTRIGEEVVLYEVQGELDFHFRLRDFAQWLAAHRKHAEMFVVAESTASTTAAFYTLLRRHGVGLLIFGKEDDSFDTALTAKNPALQVTPDPVLRYGNAKTEVTDCVAKFNGGARKDALRDLCEFVERETEKTLIVASRKHVISVPEAAIEGQDFAGQINILASPAATSSGKALIDNKLKDDLHSFRGARNLLDHKVRSKKEEQRRQCQMAERMMMGTRLMAELISLRRKIR